MLDSLFYSYASSYAVGTSTFDSDNSTVEADLNRVSVFVHVHGMLLREHGLLCALFGRAYVQLSMLKTPTAR